jgi:hypothetical protein
LGIVDSQDLMRLVLEQDAAEEDTTKQDTTKQDTTKQDKLTQTNKSW